MLAAKRFWLMLFGLVCCLLVFGACGATVLAAQKHYAFIPNSGEATVSKINLLTNETMARYFTTDPDAPEGAHAIYGNCYNWGPGRVAIDLDGNAWVLNTTATSDNPNLQGSMVRIMAYGSGDEATTSQGHDDIKPFGNDSRVTYWEIGEPGEVPRAIAVDCDGYIWVGFYAGNCFRKYDSETGELLMTVDMPGYYPFAAVVDSAGILWFISRNSPDPEWVNKSEGTFGVFSFDTKNPSSGLQAHTFEKSIYVYCYHDGTVYHRDNTRLGFMSDNTSTYPWPPGETNSFNAPLPYQIDADPEEWVPTGPKDVLDTYGLTGWEHYGNVTWAGPLVDGFEYGPTVAGDPIIGLYWATVGGVEGWYFRSQTDIYNRYRRPVYITYRKQVSVLHGPPNPYGITVDDEDNVWVTDSTSLFKLENGASEFEEITVPGSDFLRGVAVDQNGIVWMASSGNNKVICYDGQTFGEVAVDKVPCGIDIDPVSGKIYVVQSNFGELEGFVTAIDPVTLQLEEVQVGYRPSAYNSFISVITVPDEEPFEEEESEEEEEEEEPEEEGAPEEEDEEPDEFNKKKELPKTLASVPVALILGFALLWAGGSLIGKQK